MRDLTNVTLLDRYRLETELGGGMGTVYRAHDLVLKRDVAVKVLSITGLGPEGRARMLREAQSTAALNHPNIITVHDTGEAELGSGHDCTPFVVMELIQGQNLHEKPPRDLEQTIVIARQLCAALNHAHNQGVIHRDLKPENVLMAEDGAARLVDFGLARTVSSRLTTEGAIVGTLAYMAPELALAQEFDGRVDLYSLGVMLYELTTGQLPFTADDPVSIITQHLYAPVVPPRAHNPEIPPSLDALIVNLMAKEPEDRPSSAAEVLTTLEQIDLKDEMFGTAEELSLLDRIIRGRFVARKSELTEVKALWMRAMLGEGQTLLLSGEPGIGKTRLVQELITHVRVGGGLALLGQCYAEGAAPYTPFSQIVRKVVQNNGRITSDLSPFVQADLLKLAPELQPYFSDIPPNPPLEPELEQRRMFENMVAFIRHLCQRQPLLLVIEDAHWADSGTLALLFKLARRVRRLPVMILATYREEELDEALPLNQLLLDLNRERLAERVKLSRFTKQETDAMLAAMFSTEITAVFLEGVYRETEGNPFFIEEVCKSLVDSGQIYHDNVTWRRQQTSKLAIPQSVRIAIQSRVSKYPEPYQETFNLAAILGREFDFDTLVEASDLDEDTLIDALEAAEGAQLIEEVSGIGGTTFSFAHALIPITLAERVRTLRRKRLHQRAAQAIEALRPEAFEDLAHHYERAGDEEGARKYYTLAGERAAAAYANQEAESYFRAALDLGPSPPERADLLSYLAEVTSRVGRQEEAIDSWKEATELYSELGNVNRVARCYAGMTEATSDLADLAAALEIGIKGFDLTAGAPDSPDLADLIHEIARIYLRLGDPAQAETLCRKALEMARRVSVKRIEVTALITLASLPGINLEDAIATLNQAIAICQAEKLPDQEARAHNNLASIVSKGNWEHFLKAGEIEGQLGDLSSELHMLSNAAWTSIYMGEISRAAEMIPHLVEIRDQLVDPGGAGHHFQEFLGEFEHAKGNLEDAAEIWRVNFQRSLESGSTAEIAFSARFFSEVLLELDSLDEAESVIQRGVEAADQSQVYPIQLLANQAIVNIKRGNVVRARQYYDKAERIFAEHSRAWSGVYLSMAYAHVLAAEKRWDASFVAFQEAAVLLARAETRFFRAIFLQDWAQAHLGRGLQEDIELARELYREALSEFEAMGSPGYVKRLQARLDELNG